MDDLIAIAEQFNLPGKVRDVHSFGSGNINNQQPELVVKNMAVITTHMRKRLQHEPLEEGRRWEVPDVIITREGRDHWIHKDGSVWRAISFIEGVQSYRTIRDLEHGKEAGFALGMFHNLLSDLPKGRLSDTLEGFHITPAYLSHYDKVLEGTTVPGSGDIAYCNEFVRKRRSWAHVLEKAREEGRISLRTIHGDPKIDNIMIDIKTGRAVSIIDLDTVKPGLVHYDIGDCLRSGCNPLGEDSEQLENIYFDTDCCRAILQGYVSAAGNFLTRGDHDFIYDSIRLLAFELGLRFFTDFLEGDVYFRTRYEKHNLIRALVQFKLTESIESRESAIREIIKDVTR